MADTYFNSVVPALMFASLFLALLGRLSWWTGLRVLYRAVATGAVVLFSVLPVFSEAGLSVVDLLLSISPVFSIGTAAILLMFVVNRIFRNSTRVELLGRTDLLLFSLWNLIVGAALYAGTLGLLPYDLYFAGYTFSWPFVITLVLTLLAIYFRSRLVFIFLAYLIAWNHTLLPSPNFFDYIVDPFLFFVSIGVLVSYGLNCKHRNKIGNKVNQ